MQNSRVITAFFIIFILWIAVIFYFSSKSSKVSNIQSNTVVKILYKLNRSIDITDSVIYKKFENLFMEGILMGRYKGANSMVRKSAHFGMYFILAILSFILSYTYCKKIIIGFFLGISFPVTIAVLDEFNQSFIGRTSSLYDVIIDGLGALSGSVLTIFIIFILNRFKYIKKLHKGK